MSKIQAAGIALELAGVAVQLALFVVARRYVLTARQAAAEAVALQQAAREAGLLTRYEALLAISHETARELQQARESERLAWDRSPSLATAARNRAQALEDLVASLAKKTLALRAQMEEAGIPGGHDAART